MGVRSTSPLPFLAFFCRHTVINQASSSSKGLLHESPASAEPWTKEGALWGGSGGGREGEAAHPLPRARAMARLCLSKVRSLVFAPMESVLTLLSFCSVLEQWGTE